MASIAHFGAGGKMGYRLAGNFTVHASTCTLWTAAGPAARGFRMIPDGAAWCRFESPFTPPLMMGVQRAFWHTQQR
jgi:hypothetical protein